MSSDHDNQETIKVEPAVEPDDMDALRAEVERLRAENEALTARPAAKDGSHMGRRIASVVFVLLGVLMFGMAVSAVWLNRTVMDEDRWVATVAPLAQDVSIQNYVAAKASETIISSVDIQGYVGKALQPLPEQAQILALPITGAINNLITESATKVVRSEQFYTLWVQMNRYAHKAFIAAISDKSTGIIQKSGGTITLETAVLVDAVKTALVAKGLGFVSNINIPLKNQSIVLVDSPELVQLGILIRFMNTTALILPLLALGLMAGGVAIAVDRRKAVLWVGIGITAAMVIPLEAIYFAAVPFAKTAYQLGGMPQAAAQAAYTIVFRNLISAHQLFAFVGLVFVAGAILAGPNRFATQLRNGFQHGLASIGPDWDFGPVGEWIDVHASGMRVAGIIGAVVILLVSPARSIATIVWLVVAVIVWVALIALFGRPRPTARTEEPADAESPSAA
ncbi:MAG: hypothetical protein HGB10_05230 [Coriobacteriia bacterium]|nr:hypothetical protein [Coriobacteriia bacterium]